MAAAEAIRRKKERRA